MSAVPCNSTYHYVLYVNILDNLICFKDSWDVKSSDLLLTLPKTLTFINTGCPKKNALLRLMGHRGYQERTTDKSRVSFAKFRKFHF